MIWRLKSLSTDLDALAGMSCVQSPNRTATDIQVVAINDLGPVETNAHLLRFDSVHGRFPGEIKVTNGFDRLWNRADQSDRDPRSA